MELKTRIEAWEDTAAAIEIIATGMANTAIESIAYLISEQIDYGYSMVDFDIKDVVPNRYSYVVKELTIKKIIEKLCQYGYCAYNIGNIISISWKGKS